MFSESAYHQTCRWKGPVGNSYLQTYHSLHFSTPGPGPQMSLHLWFLSWLTWPPNCPFFRAKVGLGGVSIAAQLGHFSTSQPGKKATAYTKWSQEKWFESSNKLGRQCFPATGKLSIFPRKNGSYRVINSTIITLPVSPDQQSSHVFSLLA